MLISLNEYGSWAAAPKKTPVNSLRGSVVGRRPAGQLLPVPLLGHVGRIRIVPAIPALGHGAPHLRPLIAAHTAVGAIGDVRDETAPPGPGRPQSAGETVVAPAPRRLPRAHAVWERDPHDADGRRMRLE